MDDLVSRCDAATEEEEIQSLLDAIDTRLCSPEAAAAAIAASSSQIVRVLCSKASATTTHTQSVRTALECLKKLALANQTESKVLLTSKPVLDAVSPLLASESALVQHAAMTMLRCAAMGAPPECVQAIALHGNNMAEILALAKSQRLIRAKDGRTLWTCMEAARLAGIFGRCELPCWGGGGVGGSEDGDGEGGGGGGNGGGRSEGANYPRDWLWASVHMLNSTHAALKIEGAELIVSLFGDEKQPRGRRGGAAAAATAEWSRIDTELVLELCKAITISLQTCADEKAVVAVFKACRCVCKCACGVGGSAEDDDSAAAVEVLCRGADAGVARDLLQAMEVAKRKFGV